MIVAMTFLALCGTAMSNGYSSFGCKFRDEKFNLEVPEDAEAVYGDIRKPVELSLDEYYLLNREVHKISENVFTSVNLDSLSSYIDFIKAYKADKEKAAGLKLDAKKVQNRTERIEQLEKITKKANAAGFSFEKFYNNYAIEIKGQDDTTNLIIDIMNRIIAFNPKVANATYLVPGLMSTSEVNLRKRGSVYSFIAGAIKALIKTEDGDEIPTYILINQKLAMRPLSLLFFEDNNEDNQENETSEEGDDGTEEDENEMESAKENESEENGEESDEDSEENGEESDEDSEENGEESDDEENNTKPDDNSVLGHPKYNHKCIKSSDGDFIVVQTDPDVRKEDQIVALFNVTSPYCSFVETIEKPNLLLTSHSIAKRSKFGDSNIYLTLDVKRRKGPRVPLLQFFKKYEDDPFMGMVTSSYLLDNGPKDHTFYPDVVEKVRTALGLSKDKIDEFEDVLTYAFEDPSFIEECKNIFLKTVVLYKPLGEATAEDRLVPDDKDDDEE